MIPTVLDNFLLSDPVVSLSMAFCPSVVPGPQESGPQSVAPLRERERNTDYGLHGQLPKSSTYDGLCSIVNSSMLKPGLPGFNDTDGSLSCYDVEGKEKHSSRAFSFVVLFAA